MRTNHILFCLHPFSPILNPLFPCARMGYLFSLPLVGEACLNGQLLVRSGARHYTQKFVCNCRDLVFLLSATLSVVSTERALGFCLSWHISTLRNTCCYCHPVSPSDNAEVRNINPDGFTHKHKQPG